MITDKAIITTGGEMETYKIGETLGGLIDSPLVITLNGELGAGKTVLVRGAAARLGVTEPVRSPTFTLMLIYNGRVPIYHFDFYRLAEEGELETLDLDEYLEGQGVVFIEWAEKFPDCLPRERLDIHIAYDDSMDDNYNNDNNQRILTFYPRGHLYVELTDTLFEVMKHNFRGELKQ